MPTHPSLVVTGAAGHLGSHLCPLLAANEYRVTGVDVRPLEVEPVGWDFVQGELNDLDLLQRLFDGVDCIVHCASIHPWKQYTDQQYLDANVKATWGLYATAAEQGIENVVLTSSIAAIGMGAVPREAWPLTEDCCFPLGDIYTHFRQFGVDFGGC